MKNNSAKEQLKKILKGELHISEVLGLPPEFEVWHQKDGGIWSHGEADTPYTKELAIAAGTYNPIYKTTEELREHSQMKAKKNKNYVLIKVVRENRKGWAPVTRESDIPDL